MAIKKDSRQVMRFVLIEICFLLQTDNFNNGSKVVTLDLLKKSGNINFLISVNKTIWSTEQKRAGLIPKINEKCTKESPANVLEQIRVMILEFFCF